MSSFRNTRAHHVHAVIEDDFPHLLPAHDAEVAFIMLLLPRKVCNTGGLQMQAGTFHVFHSLSWPLHVQVTAMHTWPASTHFAGPQSY